MGKHIQCPGKFYTLNVIMVLKLYILDPYILSSFRSNPIFKKENNSELSAQEDSERFNPYQTISTSDTTSGNYGMIGVFLIIFCKMDVQDMHSHITVEILQILITKYGKAPIS